MPGQLSRLATLSHVLYDREVLELRHENERLNKENEALHQDNQELKLKLFWKDYNVLALNNAMHRHDMIYPDLVPGNYIWNVWIEPILQMCGLKVESIADSPPLRGSELSDVDTHLVWVPRYIFVAYGTKLWKAKSVDDPELKKLKALFEALE